MCGCRPQSRLSGPEPLTTSTQRAAQDLLDGLRSYKVWLLLAWTDLEARYRRTILGTFWQTLTMAAYIVGLAVVFSTLRNRNEGFLLYLAAGFTGFSLITGFLNSGVAAFNRGNAMLQAYGLPASLHVFRTVVNEYILFAHSIVIMVAVWIYTGTLPNLFTLLLVPAVVLMFLAGIGLVLCVGLLGARYRDVAPAVATLTSFLFLVTPIFWMREDLGDRVWVVDFNPLYHAMNLIRRPLMGEAPDLINWYVCGGIAVGSLVIGVLGFLRFRRQLVYWL
jgi:lipopolysaccharide transport system permease protein